MTDIDPTDLDSQEQAQAAKARRAQIAAKAEEEDLKWIMANKRGRRIVWGILANAGVFQLSFSTNAMTMAFNEGRRSEGLRMLALLQVHCPDQYQEMTRENAK